MNKEDKSNQAESNQVESNQPGIKPDYMDLTADPGSDFNQYANGKWIDKTEIPPEYPLYGAFILLRERSLEQVHEVLKEAAANTGASAGSNAQKLGDFFASGMDEAAIESLGAKPLMEELEKIYAISSHRELTDVLARLHKQGVGALFGLGSSPDFDNSSQVIAHAMQLGLGLPDRDYYLNNDEKSIQLRQKYLAHIKAMFELTGVNPRAAEKYAGVVLFVETALAKESMSKADRRDPAKINNPMTVVAFQKLIPLIPVKRYFKTLGAPSFDGLNVMQPDYFRALGKLLAAFPLSDWKAYLSWHVIHDAAPCLSSDFVNENFEFYGKALQGTQELRPRWKRIVDMTNGVLGEAVGQLYVERHFPPSSKTKMLELVGNLTAAFRETLGELDWMSEATKENALKKLDAFVPMIGYPDKWTDYSNLTMDRKSFMGNLQAAAEFASRRDLAKIGKPVDRLEWDMTPQTVNAYYDPTQNQIVFPAAILQPPFFDPQADDATNYGGIGMVIGHEMTHGSDDMGSKFDAQGNLNDWWTEEDKNNFLSRMELIKEQFGGFSVDGTHLNGDLVCGEAVADLGGLKLAYNALQKVLETKGRSIDTNAYTDEQRFFISFAQIWAVKARPEYQQLQVATDPHPLARFRVNGTLAHLPEFAQAFGLPTDCQMMLPADKVCRLW